MRFLDQVAVIALATVTAALLLAPEAAARPAKPSKPAMKRPASGRAKRVARASASTCTSPPKAPHSGRSAGAAIAKRGMGRQLDSSVMLAALERGPAGASNRPPASPRPGAGNAAARPAPRDAAWIRRHQGFAARAKRGGIDLVLLGDSITDGWGGAGHDARAPGARVFDREFAPKRAANFGIGGDSTQHVLWRVKNGELDGIKPRARMLMSGTKNIISSPPGQIAAGVKAIIDEVHRRSPATRVLLLGIFPRGEKPGDPFRAKIRQTNAALARFGGGATRYLDIGDRFVGRNGMITRDIMPDFLHLTTRGYQIWADAVRAPLSALLR
jgi:lysophospholipase L1-like esterase